MAFKVSKTKLQDVLVLEPQVFSDDRGFFLESFNQRDFEEATGIHTHFVQDNHSKSIKGVLRGLHYQIERPQGKLVRVISGEVFDVAVDLRLSSPSFGWWVGEFLSANNKKQMWIPPGFAHGFYVLSDSAEFLYKTTDYRFAEHERTLAWNDRSVGINWDLIGDPLLSEKDSRGKSLKDAEVFK